MKRIQKTVFISYRRTNFPWAFCIYQDLTHHGFDVFYDYQGIDSGSFEKVILENIKARAHFLVILAPSALEKCSRPNDWLRREIETALDEGRNIIPVMLESFDFGSPLVKGALTGKLALLGSYNGMSLIAEYMEAGLEKLRTRFLNVALEDVYLHTLVDEAKEITATQQAAANEAPPVERKELTAQEWFERGYVFHNSTNFSEAIRCYSEAIRLKPDYAKAYVNRGLARSDNHDLPGALADYEEAIRLKPDYAEAYNNLGNARSANNDLPGALADFDEAIRLEPDLADAYVNRGLARSAKDDLPGALADFDEAIRLKPDYAEAYYNRGIARRDNNDLRGALADYDEAIRLKPDDADAYYSLGNTHRLNGNLEDAARDYEEAIRCQPDHGLARASLMSVLRTLGRNAAAEEQEKLARGLITKENEYNQACFEAICGNVERALELLRIALEKKPSTKEWARRDPDFESIRDDARFKEIVGL